MDSKPAFFFVGPCWHTSTNQVSVSPVHCLSLLSWFSAPSGHWHLQNGICAHQQFPFPLRLTYFLSSSHHLTPMGLKKHIIFRVFHFTGVQLISLSHLLMQIALLLFSAHCWDQNALSFVSADGWKMLLCKDSLRVLQCILCEHLAVAIVVCMLPFGGIEEQGELPSFL